MKSDVNIINSLFQIFQELLREIVPSMEHIEERFKRKSRQDWIKIQITDLIDSLRLRTVLTKIQRGSSTRNTAS